MKNEKYKNSWGFWGTYDNKPQWYLLRCFNCEPQSERGVENAGTMVASGICAWCGYEPMKEE